MSAAFSFLLSSTCMTRTLQVAKVVAVALVDLSNVEVNRALENRTVEDEAVELAIFAARINANDLQKIFPGYAASASKFRGVIG